VSVSSDTCIIMHERFPSTVIYFLQFLFLPPGNFIAIKFSGVLIGATVVEFIIHIYLLELVPGDSLVAEYPGSYQ